MTPSGFCVLLGRKCFTTCGYVCGRSVPGLPSSLHSFSKTLPCCCHSLPMLWTREIPRLRAPFDPVSPEHASLSHVPLASVMCCATLFLAPNANATARMFLVWCRPVILRGESGFSCGMAGRAVRRRFDGKAQAPQRQTGRGEMQLNHSCFHCDAKWVLCSSWGEMFYHLRVCVWA